jgi:hypothetical protein
MTEPYAWVDGNSRIQSKQIDPLIDIPLYTKLEWQGLTDAEIEEFENMELGTHDLCLEIEAKLQEKNSG